MSIRDRLEKWLNYETPPQTFPICDFEKLSHGIKPGDVVLVEGRSRVADVIRIITQSRWSHSAIYIGRIHEIHSQQVREKLLEYFDAKPETQLLVEGILGKGIIVTPLTEYMQDNLRICRASTISAQDVQHVVGYCVNKLGTAYNVRQLFDLARFIFPWKILPRRW
ncbi:MAG: hypothetical protein L3J46_05795, partial [Kangiellaceae bacterium]|nr:hypothetical protein [Kangiellaceae bacterium]